jgi:hypothetical protein
MTGEKNPLDYASPPKDGGRTSYGSLIAVACFGVLPLLLGTRWLYVFVFTDYRAHHRPVMIPLGLVTTLVGVVMISLPFVLRGRR